MTDELEIVPTDRQVISQQLLSALDDTSKVAILAGENDLKLLIDALQKTIGISVDERKNQERQRMVCDLRQLQQAAFA